MFKIAIALKHLLIPRDHMISRWQNVKGGSTVIEQPTPDQGARCVWSDSQGQIWVSEWNVGKLGMYSPKDDRWKEW